MRAIKTVSMMISTLIWTLAGGRDQRPSACGPEAARAAEAGGVVDAGGVVLQQDAPASSARDAGWNHTGHETADNLAAEARATLVVAGRVAACVQVGARAATALAGAGPGRPGAVHVVPVIRARHVAAEPGSRVTIASPPPFDGRVRRTPRVRSPDKLATEHRVDVAAASAGAARLAGADHGGSGHPLGEESKRSDRDGRTGHRRAGEAALAASSTEATDDSIQQARAGQVAPRSGAPRSQRLSSSNGIPAWSNASSAERCR